MGIGCPWREGGDPLIFAYGKKGMTEKGTAAKKGVTEREWGDGEEER